MAMPTTASFWPVAMVSPGADLFAGGGDDGVGGQLVETHVELLGALVRRGRPGAQ
ncbi:MAG: hypothetical protein WAV00_17390 [Nocardioides sp.]